MRTASATATAYTPRPDPPSPLRMRRLRNGIRLNDLSVETGFSPTKLSFIERGRQPLTSAEQKTIAAALKRIAARGRS